MRESYLKLIENFSNDLMEHSITEELIKKVREDIIAYEDAQLDHLLKRIDNLKAFW